MEDLPKETQQFIEDVEKEWVNCKNIDNKSGKISIIILMCIVIIIFTVIAWLFFANNKSFSIPNQYKNYSLMKEKYIDVDKDGKEERIVAISNIPKEYTSGVTKIILIRNNGIFQEIFEEGSEFQWWEIGDFNNNGKTDIAIFCGYSGSAGFGQFSIYEWSRGKVDTILNKNDVENSAELKDLDNDGMKEVVYNFHRYKWGDKEQEIYTWDGESLKLSLNK